MLQNHFDQAKNFVLSVADSFYLNPIDGMRVGAVSLKFGLQGIPLEPFRNVTNLQNALDRFTFVFGEPPESLDLGIEFSREVIGAQGRNGVAKVLVLLTDDISALPQPVIEQAEEAKQEGFEVIMIGISSGLAFPNGERLLAVASADNFAFRLQDFTELSRILPNVTDVICGKHIQYFVLQLLDHFTFMLHTFKVIF